MIEDRFQQIPRITAPSRQVFEEEFLLQRKPVIITNLFQGEPIRDLTDVRDIRRQLGEVEVTISEGFRPYLFLPQTELQHQPLFNHQCTISDYLDLIDKDPKTLIHCSENPLPQAIKDLLELPDYCQFGPLPDDWAGRLFIGNAGNYAHLHWDGDFRQVLFYQVVGSKRIVIFPPDSSPKLAPHHHWSLFCLEHFSEKEKDDFVSYAGGVQCVVNAGETLFFPSAVWHYVEYTTAGMSVALRFGRNRYTQFLADKLHGDALLQRIAARMMEEGVVREKYQKAYQIIEDAYNVSARTIAEKIQQMSTAYRQAWSLMDGEVDPVYQLTTTGELDLSLLQVDASRYQHLLRPNTRVSGWDWLPKVEVAQISN